jgi:signal transduction histidine kinase
MNIFGNAVKYTETGHIHVSLRANEGSRATGAPTTVTLTITDSGLGMSPQFLAEKAFQPFSQENSVRSIKHAVCTPHTH